MGVRRQETQQKVIAPRVDNDAVRQRVLDFDPAEVYPRIQVDPYRRWQRGWFVSLEDAFPRPAEKICSCGCGRALEGRKYRWATDECCRFALHVVGIIKGDTDIIGDYVEILQGARACTGCGVMHEDLHLDHIIPVHRGGGGCWLGNYQFLCVVCHKEKTRTEVAGPRNKSQMSLFQITDSEDSGK